MSKDLCMAEFILVGGDPPRAQWGKRLGGSLKEGKCPKLAIASLALGIDTDRRPFVDVILT